MLIPGSGSEISKEKDEIILDCVLFQVSHRNLLKEVDWLWNVHRRKQFRIAPSWADSNRG